MGRVSRGIVPVTTNNSSHFMHFFIESIERDLIIIQAGAKKVSKESSRLLPELPLALDGLVGLRWSSESCGSPS